MKPYRHLFFDLDHTLWDFERCAEETLQELFAEFKIADYGATAFVPFLETFYQVNYHMWGLYDRNQTSKDEIRRERFPLIFERLGVKFPRLKAESLGTEYLYRCPQKPYTIAHAHSILEHLAPHYQLHILTNGFEDVQATKLKSAKLDHFFDVVVTSECTGYKKPAPQIFEFAVEKAQTALHESVMIGDNLSTDIAGAINIGMPCVFFNPLKKSHEEQKLLGDIACLLELKELL